VHSKVNYVTLTKDDITKYQIIILEGHPMGVVIINVAGADSVTLTNLPVYYADSIGVKTIPTFGRVLFNFYQCTGTLDVSNINVAQGSGPLSLSILAPSATVNSQSGPINGNVIAAAVTISATTFGIMPFGTGTSRLTGTKNSQKWSFASALKTKCLWHTL